MNYHVNGKMGNYKPALFIERAESTSDQTISNTTWTTVLWDTEAWPNGLAQWFNDEDMQLQPGLYFIALSLVWADNSTGVRKMVIRLNGSAKISDASAAATTSTKTLSGFINVPDTTPREIDCRVWQNSGGNLNLDLNNNQSSWTVWRIGEPQA